MSTISNVIVCSGTGIVGENVLYLAGEGSAEAFFTGKSIKSYGTISTVRGFTSRNSENSYTVHLNDPISFLSHCDFICYKNEKEGVFWVNRILGLEYVNEQSTRVYFEPDHYHTWVERVNFGYALVERRHLEDMSGPLTSLTSEPISVPSTDITFETPKINQEMKDFLVDLNIFVYLTSDEYSNANSPDVKFNLLGGSPFYGKVKAFETFNDVTNYLKTYVNQNGFTQTSLLPMVSNIQRIVMAPSKLMEPSLTGYSNDISEPITLPDTKFGKVYSPQFMSGVLVCTGSGKSIPFDVTKLRFSNTPTLDVTVQGCGGVHPKLRLVVHTPVDSSGNQQLTNVNVVDCFDFTEIPVSAFLPPRPTTFGAISSGFSGAKSGAEMGLLGGPEGAAAGAITGGLYNLATLNNGNGSSNYVVSGGSPEMTIAQGLYDFKLVFKIPTDEGRKILEDYFNSYGYTVMKREIVKLKYGGNFTYIKLASDATQINTNIPHASFKEINRLLKDGVRVWCVPIGTTYSYT